MTKTALLADIGGTNIRFALSESTGAPLQCIHTMLCADFEHLIDAVRQYLGFIAEQHAPMPGLFCLAVAAPVQGDFIKLTNNHWRFSRRELSQVLAMPVMVLNDFEAQGWCLLHPDQLPVRWLQKPAITDAQPGQWPEALRTIAGPGTGFGASSLSIGGEVISAEPGHAAFAPVNDDEMALLRQLWQWFPRVTVEHLISGPGIANIYCALSTLAGQSIKPDAAPSAAEIVEMADRHTIAQQTLQYFSSMMGGICGDMALTKGSRGGFVLSGNLIHKLGKHFDEQAFVRRFTDKGNFSDWCRAIPLACLLDEFPGLTGCAVYAHRSHNTLTI